MLYLVCTSICILYLFLDNMMMSKLALTSGNWEVCGKGLWVDLKYQIVYFMAVRESPLEKHLYAVSLKSPGNIKLLTKPGNSYEIDIDKVKTKSYKLKIKKSSFKFLF